MCAESYISRVGEREKREEKENMMGTRKLETRLKKMMIDVDELDL